MEAQASWERSKIKMSYSSSKLFVWLQGADFYKDLHAQAMEGLPNGEGRTWLDFGCGPGLFTRLAAAKGYSAMGIDQDPSMIREAKKIAKREASSADFAVGDVFRLDPWALMLFLLLRYLPSLMTRLVGLKPFYGR